MNINEEISWIVQNEKEMLTGLDFIFMKRMIEKKAMNNPAFRKYYEVETNSLKIHSLTDSQSRVGLLERVRSNIVRELYTNVDIVWIEASMLA